ncbi:peptidase M20 [Amylibacter marinus]|uniref:Peptidase M20 n=1 Tax=Amylibacter marinus TaxID=1475483 RepID=A0ABQ5VYL2_9RHOB|nr:M20 family peptidase [Amylibacter marinus]GLQ36229.1 peptidase M20 [Amylibacter marinus]
MVKFLTKLTKILAISLVIIIGILVFNTWRYSPDTISVSTPNLPAVDGEQIAQELSGAIRFKTLARDLPAAQGEFRGFVDYLAQTFPNAHGAMQRELINDYTPLYLWQGRDRTAAPVLLTGHYDVVSARSFQAWDQPAFDGVIEGGFVWGRGTLDDKGAIIAMMHTVDALAAKGFTPARDIYFSFGHDEEIGGNQGAGAVVNYFKDQGIQLEWSLDEGSMVLREIIPGLSKDMASINIAEKGYMTVDIVASGAGGHSSLPPRETAVGALAGSLTQLQDNPVPGGLRDVSADFFDGLGPNFSLLQRMLFANQWLFRPLLESELSKSAATDAMLRTSMAPTMLTASDTENVLAQQASATVNFRIHPRDSVGDILDHVRGQIDSETTQVRLRETSARAASPVSSTTSTGYQLLSTTFRQTFGDVIVVPGLTIAATDTRHYAEVADDSYRINPFIFYGEDIPRIHGRNERISIDNLILGVQFYTQLIQNIRP